MEEQVTENIIETHQDKANIVNESNETKTDVKEPIKKIKKPIEPGVVYLSKIPTKMNVKILRDYLGEYGELGRVYLQPSEKKRKNKVIRVFTEGWVEFINKKYAKLVYKALNNQPVRGKRRNPWYDELWNLKYLPKFHWTHINERLAYENEVRKQRLKQEIDLAKKETNFYIQNVEKSEKRKRLEKKSQNSTDEQTEKVCEERSTNNGRKHGDGDNDDDESEFKRKRVIFENKIKVKDNVTFLKQIFSK